MKTWLLTAIKYIPILLGFGKKQIEKSYTGYKSLKKIGLIVAKEDFNSLYHSTLYDFEHTRIKHKLIIDLFKEPTAIISFKSDFYDSTHNKFFEDLSANLNTKAHYNDIKTANIDLDIETNEFVSIFVSKVNESKTPKEKELSDDVKQIKDFLFSSQSVSKESIDLSEYISEISDLRKENKHEAVLKSLEKFKSKKWDVLSNELKYKLALNFAVTHFELSQKKQGAKYFIELLDYNIKLDEAYGFAALGYTLLGDNEKSIEFANKALVLNSKSENAYLALLFSKDKTLELSELDALIPKEIQELPGIAINIGTFYENKGEIESAFEIFKKLEATHPELDQFKCDILVQLANNRIKSIEQNDDYFFGQISEDDIPKLEYAIEKLTVAWDYLKDTDLRKSRWYALTNRGVVYKIMGNKDKAESDLREALTLKKSFFTYRNLLQLFFDDNIVFDKLLIEIESLPLTTVESQQVLIFKTQQAYRKNTISEILPKLINELPNVQEKDLQKQYYGTIIDIYVSENELEKAEKLALDFAELNPDDALPYMLLANVFFYKDDSDNGVLFLDKAKEYVHKSTQRQVVINMADMFFRLKDYKSAAFVLSKVANIGKFSPITGKLLTAYYHSGNYKDAHDITLELLKANPNDPFLVDLISSIYEATEQYDKAIDQLKLYLATKADDNFMIVKLAMNYYKKSDYEKGRETLDQITDFNKIPIDVQFAIADAYIKSKDYNKGLELGYQIRLANYSDQNVHSKFIQLQTGITDLKQEDYYPSVITKDCYVALTDENGKQLEFIVVENPKSEKEISITEDLGKTLVGKSLGELVSIGDNPYHIKAILWKYTYALNSSMDQIGVRFNNTGPIKVMHLTPGKSPQDSLSQFLKSIDSNIEFDRNVEELYKNGKSTIGVNANLTSLSPLKYWGKLASSPEIGVYSVWTKVEMQIGLNLLESGKDIVLDITALCSLFHLDALPLLQKISNKKYVTKSTVELIENEIAEIEPRIDTEHMVVNKVGEQYINFIVTPEEKRKQVARLTEFLKLVKENTELALPKISRDILEKQEKDRLFGKSFNETSIVAEENNYILASDDSFFRQLCFSEQKINGTNVLTLLSHFLQKNLISQADLALYLEKLIKLNYRFVPVNERILLKIYEDTKFSVAQPFINACDVLHPHYLDDIQAIKLVGNFLYELYTSLIIVQNRNFVVQFIFLKLFEGRNPFKIKSILVPFIDTKFRLLLTQKDEIFQILKSY